MLINIRLINVIIYGRGIVGGLVAENNGGEIKNSTVTGKIWGVGDNSWATGGVIGWNKNGGVIRNSHSKVDVDGNSSVGGLIGTHHDGSSHIISSSSTGDVVGIGSVGGLVGGVYFGAKVSDSHSEGTVSGNYSIGGLSGGLRDSGSIIQNSYAIGNVSGYSQVGGLVGHSRFGSRIENSFALGDVTGNESVGGLIGEILSDRGSIHNSYAKGDVNGVERVGGLAGESQVEIFNSHASGAVNGEIEVGGLVGLNKDDGYIKLSYSSGQVSGVDDVGGFVGLNGATIESSYWDIESSETTDGVGRGPTGDLTGLTTDQMTGVNVYVNMPGLNFEEIWASIPEDYPRLLWSIAYYQLTNITSNAPITEGQALTIELMVKNIGGVADTQAVALRNDVGDIIDSVDKLILDSGQEQSITLQWQTGEGDEGEYTFIIASEYDQQTIQFNVRVLPAKVELKKPESQQVNVPIMPLFEWKEAELADLYQLQISDENSFEEPLFNFDNLESVSHQMTEPLDHLSDYYWRVRGVSDYGDGEWSEVWSFTTIIEQPDAVALVSPDSGSVDISITSELQWQESERAEYYRIILSRDSEFTEVVQDSSEIAGVSFSPDELQYNTDYFWKVKAINVGGESEWSETWSFFTEFALDQPVLVGPGNNSEFVEAPVFLRWKPVIGAQDYIIEVSHDSSFEELLDHSARGKGGLKNQSIQLQQSEWGVYFELKSVTVDTVYYWRVKAENEQGMSEWSETWRFTTGVRIPDIPVWEPQDGQSDVELTPLLVWGASDRAVMYDLRLSDDPGFSNLIINESELPDTEYQVTGELEKALRYYWKVRAGNQSGYSEWSNVLSFVTVAPTSVEQDELPISYELQQNYPNPFNPSTQIRFALPEQAHVRLTVYNLLGQQVSTIVNETRPAGWHDVTFDASGLSSGVFIYRFEANGYVETKSMMFVK